MPQLPLRALLLADEYVMSGGCIPLKPLPRDPTITTPRLPEDYSLIYIRKRSNGDQVLAKGRKDVHEPVPNAAVRETFEETGYKSTIIALPTPSLAPGVKDIALNKESVAMSLRVDKMSREDKKPVQKLIFWWVSEVDTDEKGEPVKRVEGTQLAYEDYEVCEMSLDQSLAEGGLTFEEDRKMLEQVKKLLIKRHKMHLAK